MRMGRLVFITLWNGVAAYVTCVTWLDAAASPAEKGILLLFLLFGLLMLRLEWPNHHRRRSLRRERRGGVDGFAWVELDGSVAWSREDPTSDRNAADGDADGGD